MHLPQLYCPRMYITMMTTLRRIKNLTAILSHTPVLSEDASPSSQSFPKLVLRSMHQDEPTKSLLSMLSRTDTSVRILVPGWSFDDLDRHGKLRLWKALNVIDRVREYAFDKHYLDYRQVENTHMTYVRCLNIDVKKIFLEKHSKGHFAYSYPFIIDTKLTHIGRTSCCIHHTIEDSEGNQIMQSNITYVFVENISKKVSTGPAWWMDKYKPFLGDNTKPYILKEKPVTPAVSNTFKMVVMPVDIDYYGHVNNTAYQQFCTNAGMALAHKGLLGNVDTHTFDTKLHKIEAVYINDCKVGDELEIQVEVDHLEKICTFNILKDKSVLVYQQIVSY